MYFLFSGEGPTDLGFGMDNTAICEGEGYHHGPMAVVVDKIVEKRYRYSVLETQCCGFISKHMLVKGASQLKTAKKALRLPGKRRAKETRYFFNNARVLAWFAKEQQARLRDNVVAVLFRDADTGTAGRGPWSEKQQSMLDGFKEEQFLKGVPMIPRPASEAWVLCALKEKPYRSCAELEERSGSRNAPHSLKAELQERLGHPASREELCEMVTRGIIDIERIDMPSFASFRSRLEEVI
jgi:hypothetical protein